jgi:hypothetical protein
MKVLVVDSISAASSPLGRGINKTLGCGVLCASSPQDALHLLRTEKDRISVIVHSLELGPEAGLSFIQQIKEYCKAAAIRVPRFVALTPGPLPPGDGRYESLFRIMDVECLHQGNEPQLHTIVSRMMFESACEKGRPTIIVDRSEPETRFFILGAARSQLILCGPSLIPIFNYVAIHFGTAISTRTLAEVADKTEASVRVYWGRLIARFDEARLKVGVEIPGKDAFHTFRRDGAYVHMLCARVKFR